MTNEQETAIARMMLRAAGQWACAYSLTCDESAATAAILCRALELATPDLSPQARSRLFLSEDVPLSSLEIEYDLGTYGDWMSDENQH